MGLLNDFRDGIATLNLETKDIQAQVRHEKYLSSDRTGKKSYDTARTRPAIVIKKQKQVRDGAGDMVMSNTQVLFLDPSVIISTQDRITLPDGTTGPILSIDGFIDRGTGNPMLTEVALGTSGGGVGR